MATNKRNNVPLIIGGVLIVALLAIVAAVATAVGNKDDKGKAATPAGRETVPYQQVAVAGQALVEQGKSGTPDAAIGSVAPNLVGKNFVGDPVEIKNDGRAKVVVFYAHWCPHCQKELPLISDWIKSSKSKYPKVDLYAVATATSPTRPNYPPADWFTRVGYQGPVLVDSQSSTASAAYGLTSYPFMVALDSSNKVVGRTSGELPMSDFEKLFQSAAGAPAA